MATAKKVEDPEYDRDAWEYLTYAPGHQCSACTRTVKPLEPVRRGAGEGASGVPVVIYRHAERCPSGQGVTA
jgi:hypothetical protein